MVSPWKQQLVTSSFPSFVAFDDERGVIRMWPKFVLRPRREVAETSDFSDISHAEVVATGHILSMVVVMWLPVSGSVVEKGQRSRRAAGLIWRLGAILEWLEIDVVGRGRLLVVDLGVEHLHGLDEDRFVAVFSRLCRPWDHWSGGFGGLRTIGPWLRTIGP